MESVLGHGGVSSGVPSPRPVTARSTLPQSSTKNGKCLWVGGLTLSENRHDRLTVPSEKCSLIRCASRRVLGTLGAVHASTVAFAPLPLPWRAPNLGDGGMWLSPALGLRSQVQRELVCFSASGCSESECLSPVVFRCCGPQAHCAEVSTAETGWGVSPLSPGRRDGVVSGQVFSSLRLPQSLCWQLCAQSWWL